MNFVVDICLNRNRRKTSMIERQHNVKPVANRRAVIVTKRLEFLIVGIVEKSRENFRRIRRKCWTKVKTNRKFHSDLEK